MTIKQKINTKFLNNIITNLERLDSDTRRYQRELVRDTYLADLRKIVDEFKHSDFQFQQANKQNTPTRYSSGIRLQPGVELQRASGTIPQEELWRYLNDGTQFNAAFMPEDFSNETFPGSLYTKRVEYDRDKIVLNVKLAQRLNRPGLEPRHFEELLAKKYDEKFFERKFKDFGNARAKVLQLLANKRS